MSATLRTSISMSLILLTAPLAILDQVRELGQGGRAGALLRRLPTQAKLPESRTAQRYATALPPWLVARHQQRREHTMKPARKAISTPAGVRAHGAPLGVGNRCGVRDWVAC